VVRVLEDHELHRELAQRGGVYARSWSSAVMAARLGELYQTLRSAPGAVRAAA
jgi:hypothetical protein